MKKGVDGMIYGYEEEEKVWDEARGEYVVRRRREGGVVQGFA